MSDQVEQPQSMSIEEAAAQLNAQMQQQGERQDVAPAEEGVSALEIESQEATDEVEAGAEGDETEQQETNEGSEDAGPSIETLSDLAEALGQPLDDVLNNLTTTITVDGESKQVSLKDAFDGYNLAQASQQRMKNVAEEKRHFEAEKKQHMADLEKQHQVLGGVLSQMRNAYIGQINSAELDRLKVDNPAEWAAARMQIEDRVRAFDQLIQQGAEAYAELDGKRTSEKQAHLTTYAQGEREKLLEAIPDWNDSERNKVFGYLQGIGYTDAQLGNVFDHREIVIARKAMLYDQMQEKAKTATAKVKQLPKLAKPGPKQSGVKVESAAIEKARRRFAQTKSLEDAAAFAALQMK